MSDKLRAAYEHCRRVTSGEARNFYYGFLLLPAEQRRSMYAAYAFARGCDDLADGGAAVEEAGRLLDRYAEGLEEALGGSLEDPVFAATADTVRRYSIPPTYFRELIDGVRLDLSVTRYETFAELERYCYGVASLVGLISIEIFGYRGGERARGCAADLGIALQLTNILRDIQEDAARGRVYLPQEDLREFGYPEPDLLAGAVTPALWELIAFESARAREYYARGLGLLPYLPRRARACVGAMAGIYRRILDGIERDPAAVFRRRVSVGTPQKLALAGRELVRSMVS